MITDDENCVRVEMKEETLLRLLSQGMVCAADFQCLDCRSKECLRRLCLKCCLEMRNNGATIKNSRLCSRCSRCAAGGPDMITRQF